MVVAQVGSRLHWLLVAGGLASLGAAGCNALVEVDDYRFDRPPGAGGAGQGGSGGSGAGGPSGCIWGKSVGDPAEQHTLGARVDGQDNLLLAGWFEGTIDLGCEPITASGTSDLLVAKLGPDGDCLWSNGYGNIADQGAAAIAADGSDNVLVTGYFDGTLELGCGALAAAGGWDFFVAKLGPSGACLWSHSAGDTSTEDGWAVAADAAGNVLVAGDFQDTLDLGGSCETLIGGGDFDAFVAKYDASGGCLWSRGAGDAAAQVAYGVGADAAGNVLVAGYTEGGFDFGCGAMQSAGSSDLFVAKLDPNGNCLWARPVGAVGDQAAWGMAADGDGNMLVTGFFEGTLDLGCGGLVSSGGADLFVAKLGPDGSCVWSSRAGGASDQYGYAVEADDAGNVLLSGYFDGSLDLGCAPIASEGSLDLLVARLDPSGACLWSKRAGDDANTQYGNGVSADHAGNVLLAADFEGSVDLGCGEVTSRGGFDSYIVKLAR